MFNISFLLCSAFAPLATAEPVKMNYSYDQCDNKYNFLNKQQPVDITPDIKYHKLISHILALQRAIKTNVRKLFCSMVESFIEQR